MVVFPWSCAFRFPVFINTITSAIEDGAQVLVTVIETYLFDILLHAAAQSQYRQKIDDNGINAGDGKRGSDLGEIPQHGQSNGFDTVVKRQYFTDVKKGAAQCVYIHPDSAQHTGCCN